MRAIVPTKHNYTIPNVGEIELNGYSRSSFRTGFILKPWGIYMDAGVPSEMCANIILITHGHYDHIASLPSILRSIRWSPAPNPSAARGHGSSLLYFTSSTYK